MVLVDFSISGLAGFGNLYYQHDLRAQTGENWTDRPQSRGILGCRGISRVNGDTRTLAAGKGHFLGETTEDSQQLCTTKIDREY